MRVLPISPERAESFLALTARQVGTGGGLLIGVDLEKSRRVLDAAYNDSLGVTAEFNLNLLRRMNRELGADFDLNAFHHRAFYDEDEERIEIRLVALRAVEACLASIDLPVQFAAGEELHTEISCKFRRETVARDFGAAGMVLEDWYTDEANDFALALGRGR